MSYDFPQDTSAFYDVDVFGDNVSFQRLSGGDPITTVAIIDTMIDGVPDGFETRINEPVVMIWLPYKDVGVPERGDTITVDANVYTVDGLVSNDEIDIKVYARQTT